MAVVHTGRICRGGDYPHLMDILNDVEIADLRVERPDLARRVEQALGDFGLSDEDLTSPEVDFPYEDEWGVLRLKTAVRLPL